MLLSDIAKAVNGRLKDHDVTVSSVDIDSRRIQAGQLFVALKGERFDGHDFLAQVGVQGAVAALVSQPVETVLPLVEVLDTRIALGQLAAYHRQQLGLPLIAITGSNGKTTTKEMTAAMMQAHFKSSEAVLATDGNFNNDIGMPLTLLRLRQQHKVAVIEMGMNHLGEIDYLAKLARPNVAVINNAGTAHIGELGSRENIAKAKGEIFAGLGEDGIAVVNADDRFADYWLGLNKHRRVLQFGLKTSADVYADAIQMGTDTSMRIHYQGQQVAVRMAVIGQHNVYNALAAATVSLATGASLQAVAQGLADFGGVKGRLQHKLGLQGVTLIDDTYNANPDSMKAAIDVCVGMGKPVWFVMGDMGEMGADARALHAEVGAYANQKGIAQLFALGELTAHAVNSFGNAGKHFADIETLIEALKVQVNSEVLVLVKGSRFMKMERVVEALMSDQAETVSGKENTKGTVCY